MNIFLRFIFFFYICFNVCFSVYSDGLIDNDNLQTRNIIETKKQQNKEQKKENGGSDFYKKAYSVFRKMYNGAHLTHDEMLTMKTQQPKKEYIPTNVRTITLKEIKKNGCLLWKTHENQYYNFDNYPLCTIYHLYSPRNFLEYEINREKSNKSIYCGRSSGHIRFNIFKKNIFDVNIYDTQQPLFKISSCFNMWHKGFLCEGVYNVSVHKNLHIGATFYIPILLRFYNDVAFKKNYKNNKEIPYFFSSRYLFAHPFLFHILYKNLSGRYTIYFNFSQQIFSVDESGGCKCEESVLNSDVFKINNSNFSIYDAVTTGHVLNSFFLYNQYEFDRMTIYLESNVSFEKDEIKIDKRKVIEKPHSKINQHTYIQDDTFYFLGLCDKKKRIDTFFKKNTYFSQTYIEGGIKKSTIILNRPLFFNVFLNCNFKTKYFKTTYKNKEDFFVREAIKCLNSKNYDWFIEQLFGVIVVFSKVKVSTEILLTDFTKTFKECVYGNANVKYKNNYFKCSFGYICQVPNVFILDNISENFTKKLKKQKSIHMLFSTRTLQIKERLKIKGYLSFLLKMDGFYNKWEIFKCEYISCSLKGEKNLISSLMSSYNDDNCVKKDNVYNNKINVYDKKINKFKELFENKKNINNKIKRKNSEDIGTFSKNFEKESSEKVHFQKLRVSQNKDCVSTINIGFDVSFNIVKYTYTEISIFILKKIKIKGYTLIDTKNDNVNERLDNLPLFNFYFKFYYKRELTDDRSASISCGIKISFNTSYIPDMFDVMTQKWCNQSQKNGMFVPENNKYKLGEIKTQSPWVFVNLFFTSHIGNLNISWQADDLLQLFFKVVTITAPYYPNKPWSPFNFIISYMSTD